jgi:hypothetical protein
MSGCSCEMPEGLPDAIPLAVRGVSYQCRREVGGKLEATARWSLSFGLSLVTPRIAGVHGQGRVPPNRS